MHTPSDTGILVFCFSVGVGKRSSGALPPVGGAQQSQVAVGGTWSAAEEEEEGEEGEATGQQPASVCPKTGWKTQGSGQVEVFSAVPVASEAFSHQGHPGRFFLIQGRWRMCANQFGAVQYNAYMFACTSNHQCRCFSCLDSVSCQSLWPLSLLSNVKLPETSVNKCSGWRWYRVTWKYHFTPQGSVNITIILCRNVEGALIETK